MIIEKLNKQKILFWSFFALFGVVYTMQVVLNHYYFRTYALDYGFYNQAFWDFAHFRLNANTVFEPPLGNYFQVHPAFTLPLLSPLYWLFNPFFGTYSLLIIQNVFILLGGYGTYLLVIRKTDDFWIALLAFIHYNVLWGHFSALAADYIDATVVSSTMPWFFLLFDKKKFIPAGIVFLFVITCKENMPIWFIFVALTLILTYRDRTSRLVAAGLGIFSLLYLVLLFKVLIPGFENPDLKYWGFGYSALGDNPAEAIQHIFRHPIETARQMIENHSGDPEFNGIKIEFYIVFLLSGGVLLLIRPVYLIMFIPLVAQKMLNDSFVRWGIMGFYSIEIVSVLTLAVFLATRKIGGTAFRYILYALLCISTIRITYLKMQERTAKYYDERKENFFSAVFYQTENNAGKIRKQIEAAVPENANVCAMQDIVPHLAYRKDISVFPYVRNAEYLIFLLNGNPYPLKADEYMSRIERYVNDPGWEEVVNDYPLVIFHNSSFTGME
ncbi:MAG TPA: DUF2079 domain-containing protein [Bacteroidales bacterium]|nr:DUF2079 domain-containing protein [Bacteroidales bacterium]